jgi:D-glycero-D-manno-heptose 1,7-bisphosphate phosphatase
MKKTVESNGGRITDVFFCPHHPDDKCRCRKPQTGMIMAARDKYTIDLSGAVMIGDSVKDIECARNAKVGTAILVRTGNGETAEKTLRSQGLYPDYIADDLLDAVNRIIETGLPILRHA